MNRLYEEIGYRIAILRQAHNLTQEKLAELLDVSVKHISFVERGKSSLSLEKLVKIGEILDCTMDYLLLGKSYDNIDEVVPKTLIEIMRSDDVMKKDLLQEYMNFFVKIQHME